MKDFLGVKGVRTSPYHPQTDGLGERFNGTLKSMIRKVLSKFGDQRDKALPYYVQFAYREVPQESTGYSPFELVFGRQPRGPLDVLKEEWVQCKLAQSVMAFMQRVMHRMDAVREIVHDNDAAAKHKQKTWYDRTARQGSFNEGDMVLVLLLLESSKLKVQWQGPYPVVRKISDTTYELNMTDRRSHAESSM